MEVSFKIKPETKYYDFIEMCKTVDKELGYNQRNCGKIFYPETTTFDEWHKAKKYPQKDPQRNHKNSSQLWFAEYKQEILEGKIKEDVYCDFWHFQLDNCVPDDFRNDSYSRVYVGMGLNFEYEWQRVIQQKWNELFKDLADDSGWVDIEVSW